MVLLSLRTFSIYEMLLNIIALVATLISVTSAQDANCDFTQNVQVGQSYYVYSPNYPNNYNPGVTCRWIANCPTGYNCRLACSEINLPYTTSCTGDRLLISKTGDPTLTGAERYCGQGTLTATSVSTSLSIGLLTQTTSSGGRFMCTLTAQPASSTGACSCGYKKSNRIVGGSETGANEYPMMVGLRDNRIGTIYCGGTIISTRYVMSAAHCVAGMSYTNINIVVGEHNTASSTATQVLPITGYLAHPQYNTETYDCDICLIKTASDIIFSDRVGPGCLPFKFVSTDFTGRKLTVLGWGTQFFGGPQSTYLQKVDLDVISQTSCRSAVSTLTSRQICTYTPYKDSCQYDSGGPGLYTDPDTGLLFIEAIISYGRFCASGQPGVNTKVTEMLSWITSNTADATYCRK